MTGIRQDTYKAPPHVGNRPQFVKSAPLSVALREAGIDEVVLHTGQHYDHELSQVFFEELGLRRARYRLDLHTRRRRADAAAIAVEDHVERPTSCSSTGTPTRRSRARAAARGRRPGRARRGGPAERRPRDAGGAQPHRGRPARRAALRPDDRSRETLAGEGVADAIDVVGDVMADASFRFAPIARGRSSRIASRLGVERALRRRDDPPRGERREPRLGA